MHFPSLTLNLSGQDPIHFPLNSYVLSGHLSTHVFGLASELIN